MKSDPKSFWNMLNKLNKLSESSKEENLNEKEFIEFFEKMHTRLDRISNNEFHKDIISKFNHLKSMKNII